MSIRIINADCRIAIRDIESDSVNCCVTSPPYFGLRDYGVAGQLGLEKSPSEYVAALVGVFKEVRRVLRNDGTVFLNLGDTYSSIAGGYANNGDGSSSTISKSSQRAALSHKGTRKVTPGLKPKDLIGIPWRAAFALQEDGWYLRSEITWCKKVPMPESVRDRPTIATEKIFLLTKSSKYFYDSDAVRNPPSESFANDSRWKTGSTPENEKNGYAAAGAQNPKAIHRMFDKKSRGHERRRVRDPYLDDTSRNHQMINGSNMRNFWVLGPEPFKGSHFATFPTEIPRRCILAGCPVGGTVLDPFSGSGTTGKVALELGRNAILIELNPDYAAMSEHRTNTTPGFAL